MSPNSLACTPTGPASLDVLVAPGSVYSIQNVDGTAYGSLEADTAHQIMKQGISLDTLTLSCPAPGTTGQSINYLIQAAYQDVDTGSTVLPYFDSDNPDVAFNGPDNTGVSQNTVREGQCVVSVKAGVAATTGSQTTPAPTAGYTGLWVVTVANGQTTITSGNISMAGGAPFISEKLGDKISIPTGDARYLKIGTARTQLTGNQTYYVATTGNDSTGNGTSGNPWATRQKAWNYIQQNIDLAGYTAIIQLADGTYTGGFSGSGNMVGQFSPAQIVFNGNSGTPSNVVINPGSGDCFSAVNGAQLTVQNMKLENSSGNGVEADSGGRIAVGAGMIFGACSANHAYAAGNQGGGGINFGANYTIAGNAISHWQSTSSGSQITVAAGLTITLSGTPAFTQFAGAAQLGEIFLDATVPVFSGSATGSRYNVNVNGAIVTQGSGSTYLPGNSVGTTATGGQYP